jgi:hypothetical protein
MAAPFILVENNCKREHDEALERRPFVYLTMQRNCPPSCLSLVYTLLRLRHLNCSRVAGVFVMGAALHGATSDLRARSIAFCNTYVTYVGSIGLCFADCVSVFPLFL